MSWQAAISTVAADQVVVLVPIPGDSCATWAMNGASKIWARGAQWPRLLVWRETRVSLAEKQV